MITRYDIALALAAISLPAAASAQSLGGTFNHVHQLGFGNTNFGSTFKVTSTATAANYATGWFAGAAYSSINASFRARVLSSTEHDVVKGQVYGFATPTMVTGSTQLTIGNLDFTFWPVPGDFKSIGGNHDYSHWYGWTQWFGRLVQGSKYFSGILLESRISSTVEVNSQVTMDNSPRQVRTYLNIDTFPYVTVQVTNTSLASIEGHIKLLFPDDATFTLDARDSVIYGSGVVDYPDSVSMVMWINRPPQAKIMLGNTGMLPRDYFPQSMWVGGKYYNGFRLF